MTELEEELNSHTLNRENFFRRNSSLKKNNEEIQTLKLEDAER